MSTDLSALRLHAHFDEGSGPVIVMLHGINSDGGDWRTVIDTIGPGYRYVAFDLLGFGRSPKPLDIDYTADDHALVIESTLVDMGVTEPFLLVGYSLGGDIALRYASTYPHRLRRLFLLDAPFYLPPSELKADEVGIVYAFQTASRRLWNALATSGKTDGFVYRLATGVAEKPLEEAFHAEDIPTHWEIMSKNLENTVNAATWVDDLPRLTMPVVHAIGVRDAIVRVSQAPALKRLKPDMEIRRIGGLAADHMVLWNMPERVAEEIVRDEVRELNVAWRGGKGRPLVFLHDLQDDSIAWLPAAQVLARTHDVAILDLLGFGDSPAPLSLHYTLADHVAAVLGTLESLWGHDRPVLFVGSGVGANIAMGCAATAPRRSAGVVAFSPALLESAESFGSSATDARSAQVVAMRESLHRLLDTERRRGGSAEHAETRLVPIVRTAENAVIGVDAPHLLEATPPPVRFVVPDGDTLTHADFLGRACAHRDGFEIDTVPGDRRLPFEHPAEVVRVVAPDDAEGIAQATRATAAPGRRADNPVYRATLGVENALLRSGVLNLAAAAVIAALNPVPGELLTLGFAAWVAVASLSAIVGAVGMRRQTRGTRFTFATTALPTLLLGLVGLALASAVFADPELGRRFFGASVAIYAMVRGVADLITANRAVGAGKPRWLLRTGGAIGLITAAAILFGPDHGRGLVRLSLAIYLALSGLSLVGFVVAGRRAAKRRVRALLAEREGGS